MKQRRLNTAEKIELIRLWETGLHNCVSLSTIFNVSDVAIRGLLKRRGFSMKPQTELRRKYPVIENFFDDIDTECKAYFLGLLYADGYNNVDRFSVSLSLKESDKDILTELNNLIQPTKPLQYVKIKSENASNQYRLVIANKHISQTLAKHGCVKAKTFLIEFPMWLPNHLVPHFIRGYFDGDGYVGKSGSSNWCVSIVGTQSFCQSIQAIIKAAGINSFLEARHTNKNHNIVQLRFGGRLNTKLFHDFIYQNSTIYLSRKKATMDKCLIEPIKHQRVCLIENCFNKHLKKGYCQKHYYAFGGGKERRKYRYQTVGK